MDTNDFVSQSCRAVYCGSNFTSIGSRVSCAVGSQRNFMMALCAAWAKTGWPPLNTTERTVLRCDDGVHPYAAFKAHGVGQRDRQEPGGKRPYERFRWPQPVVPRICTQPKMRETHTELQPHTCVACELTSCENIFMTVSGKGNRRNIAKCRSGNVQSRTFASCFRQLNR